MHTASSKSPSKDAGNMIIDSKDPRIISDALSDLVQEVEPRNYGQKKTARLRNWAAPCDAAERARSLLQLRMLPVPDAPLGKLEELELAKK